MERRLAAILAADVVGYTRIMGADETGTLKRLTELRQHVLEPLIAQHHGRVVKLMGDGLLVEFASVVDALACAVAWQNSVAEREAETEEDRRLLFRIGINLGDVIVEGDDIHGDGVNIAARLEDCAEPGRICLSDDAYRQVRGKIEAEFEDLGEHNLKNVAEPIRVYRIASDGTEATPKKAPLTLPDKPSIAVLPFDNLSNDPDQEYFSDGVTEDIITALSRFRWLFVIARNSTFQYRGTSRDIRDIAQNLGVRYVVEGSVRKAGNRVRVTAQLIDAATGNHIWAQRYDRELVDIFDLQDDLTDGICGALAPELMRAEARRAQRKSPQKLDAWDLVMQARPHMWRMTNDGIAKAEELLRRAIELDPNSAIANSDLAHCVLLEFYYRKDERGWQLLEEAYSLARKAVEIDDLDAWGFAVLGVIDRTRGRVKDAERHYRRALELDPNLAHAHASLGWALAYLNDVTGAFQHIKTAIRLSPNDPVQYIWFVAASVAAFTAEDYVATIDWATRAIRSNELATFAYRTLAASLALTGREDEAREVVLKALIVTPGLSLGEVRKEAFWEDASHTNRFLDGLRRAGLSE